VNLASTEPNDLLFAAGLWHQKMQKKPSARSSSHFIVQNYSMKKYGTMFTVCIKFTRKNKNIFKPYFVPTMRLYVSC
jgi:hypothetical protein